MGKQNQGHVRKKSYVVASVSAEEQMIAFNVHARLKKNLNSPQGDNICNNEDHLFTKTNKFTANLQLNDEILKTFSLTLGTTQRHHLTPSGPRGDRMAVNAAR